MKSIRYATYIAIALHFIRLIVRRVFTRIMHLQIKDYRNADNNYCSACYAAKVVLFYKIVFSPNVLFALECYTTWNSECEKLFNYLEDRYKNFNDGLCMFDSGEDVQYALKECLDHTLRNTIINSSPILGEGLTVWEIIADITLFAKENFHYEPSFNNFRVCEID